MKNADIASTPPCPTCSVNIVDMTPPVVYRSSVAGQAIEVIL
jgi:hypothetical protein